MSAKHRRAIQPTSDSVMNVVSKQQTTGATYTVV